MDSLRVHSLLNALGCQHWINK